MAKLTGITRAAARRYLHTLTKLNYADFDGRYFTLSPRILRLGYAYLSSASLSARLQPFLEKISEATGESSSAAMLDGDDIVYIARSATRRIMSIGLGVGSRLPAYCTSLGRAILAYQPEDEIEAYLERVRLEAEDAEDRHRKPNFAPSSRPRVRRAMPSSTRSSNSAFAPSPCR